MKKSLLFFIAASLLLVACSPTDEITSFEECVEAGYPIMESYPEQCSDGTNTFVNSVVTFTVESELADCVGVGPQECMIVNGEFFYSQIAGFNYTEGYEYVLEVKVTERENVPADASKYMYELVEIVSEEKVAMQQACTREYRPVCGEVEVECITTPCDPIQTTFSNACEAENADAEIVYEGACIDETVNPQGACLSFDGNWLEGPQECEGMAQTMCEDLGGEFQECASSCRNDPDAQICTLQCVQVCSFE